MDPELEPACNLDKWPPIVRAKGNRQKNKFCPPMNTDEHRLKNDQEKAFHKIIYLIFIRLLSVFIGVHRWIKSPFLDSLNSSFFGVFSFQRSL